MGTLDKIKAFRNSKPAGGGNFSKQRDIFFKYKDGSNVVRLVGEFVRVETHYISPDPKRKDRGLCIPGAFDGEGSLPRVMNCLDWDLEKEQPTTTKTCPICKLHRVAHAALKEAGDSIEDKDKKYLEGIRSASRPSTSLKWNIIDRSDPYITEEKPDGSVAKILGYKVINVGMEAWNDIEGIFSQMDPVDITDIEEGMDIDIIKDHNGVRTCYKARVMMQGKSAKVTPLTEAERAMQPHDLKRLSKRLVDAGKLVDSLHDDLRALIEDDAPAAAEEASEPAPAPKTEAPAPKPAAPKTAPAKAPLPAVTEEPAEEAAEGSSEGSDFQCKGTAQENHPECKQCPELDECIAIRDSKKKGVKKAAK
jgi:hypothetical protein